ncbi:uncharacterized protein [Blastocystis hominis]|uniref:Uncharacterized protein n=1 Tax=Blastocystis hominis TaxID=12968 RepID=D8LY30_BLAHO|nr:uncharacterized protein [Blastocystis hominis]CBK20485.2 unnamed protein product [Blastocystis hominis]|eukprot:XP_012894533.1 uncharacterized protein [Blastocystis hominis]
MKSLPRDIRGCYITTYSLKGNDDKVFEHPMSEIKAGDLDLWTTETEEKVKDHLYEQMGDNVPHPFWEAEAGKIVEDYESKGLPPCPGKMYQWECPKEMESGLW